MKAMCGILLAMTALCGVARGDGKFFRVDKAPVGVPYQRAILHYEDGRETLILQSKYAIADGETAPTLAWVVPVPAVPELASMDADYATYVFMMVGMGTGSDVTSVLATVLVVLFLLGLVVSLLGLGIVVFAGNTRLGQRIKNAKPVGIPRSAGVILVLVLILLFVTAMPLMSGGIKSVDVLKAENVGIYEVKVIRGDSGGAVAGWLKENGFGYDQADEGIFEDYVKDGWCFVAAKVSTKADPNGLEVAYDGLAAPLILRFDAKEAVYPMRLTANTKGETEVLLYVFAEHKMECQERLGLTYADTRSWPFSGEGNLRYYVEPVDFFSLDKSGQACKATYMTKFKGKMTPEQMKDDLVFTQAKDDEPYREHVYRW